MGMLPLCNGRYRRQRLVQLNAAPMARTGIKASRLVLSYSHMPFVRCHHRETQECVFDAHDRAFSSLGGTIASGAFTKT